MAAAEAAVAVRDLHEVGFAAGPAEPGLLASELGPVLELGPELELELEPELGPGPELEPEPALRHFFGEVPDAAFHVTQGDFFEGMLYHTCHRQSAVFHNHHWCIVCCAVEVHAFE